VSGFVLDSSLALTWCFRDEATPADWLVLDRAEAEFAAVPAIWPLEVANVLALAERKGRIAAAEIAEFVARLDDLDIRIDEATATRGLRDILALARRESLTSYDAAYLDLAMREGLPLATRDVALADAARRLGVAVIAA
jgi:predicted nucleic acid-binding protein